MGFQEWQFNRAVKAAQKRFQKVSDLADKLRMGKKPKRELIKSFFRSLGYGHIRIKERQ